MRPQWRDEEPRALIVCLGAIVWILAFVIIASFATGCANPQVKSACVVEAPAEQCWTVKKKNLGRPLSELTGHFCINMQDTARLLRRLNECANGDVPAAVSVEFRSLCVIEGQAKMCWVKKSEGIGRPFSSMEGDNCVDRPDLDQIMDKLNECMGRTP